MLKNIYRFLLKNDFGRGIMQSLAKQEHYTATAHDWRTFPFGLS